MNMTDKEKLLSIQNLYVSFDTYAGEVQAVRDISFDIYKGEVLALVGESGCGKSVSSQSTMKLPSPPTVYKGGKIVYQGKNLIEYSQKQMESIRGSEIAFILQDPMTSLNPTMRIGKQITESIFKHQDDPFRSKQAGS